MWLRASCAGVDVTCRTPVCMWRKAVTSPDDVTARPLRSGGDAAVRLGEDGGQLATEQEDGGDDRDGDQRDEQAVLDGGGAALGLGHAHEADLDVLECFEHFWSPK